MPLRATKSFSLTATIGVMFALSVVIRVTGAQTRPASEVPKEIVRQLIMSEVLDRGLIDIQGDGTAKGLSASFVDLNRDNRPEVVVSGIYGVGGICGNANCAHWIFGETANGYRLLLDAGSVQQLEPQTTVANSYRDIQTTRHDSAFDYTIIRYRFDGTRYRPQECFERHFDSKDDGGSRVVRGNKPPVITRIRC